MKISQQILACLLVLALTIKEGLSLTCYKCNSFTDKTCNSPNEQTETEECTANQTMCRKVEQEIYYHGSDHTRIFRQCATRGELGECLERTGTYRFKSWYCQCEGSLCNGGGNMVMSVTLIGGMIAAVFGLRKLL